MNITDQIRARLAETTKLAENATEGPWDFIGISVCADEAGHDGQGICIANIESDGGYEAPEAQQNANGEFIAAARTTLPARDRALMVAVDALTEECGKFAFPDEDRPILHNALAAILSILNGEAK